MGQFEKDRGQILVLVAIGLIGLLGFTALAIDGSLILSQRRFLQTVADSASLAGAGRIARQFQSDSISTMDFNCSSIDSTTAGNEAEARALDNQNNYGKYGFDFTLDHDLSDGQGVDVDCDSSAQVVRIHVMLTQPVETSFAHLFYSGNIENSVESTVEIYPMHDLGFGNTIVSLQEKCDSGDKVGVTFDGSSTVTIKSGGVWSNSCLNATGTKLQVVVDDGSITYNSGYFPYKNSGDPEIDPDPITTTEQIKKYEDIHPNCDHESLVDGGDISTDGETTIYPGIYTSITVNKKEDHLIMEPGLYCLTGDFKANGGSITGNGVTIYMMRDDKDQDTNLQIGGNAGSPDAKDEIGSIQLTAPLASCDSPVCPPAIKGLLIYVDWENKGNVTLQGNDSSIFNGTVYAPNGSIDLGGASNGATDMGVQVLGDEVKIHGNVNLNVFTSADAIFLTSPSLSHTQ